MERIPVAGPWITEKEVNYVADAAANAWYSSANMYHERFEAAVASYIGRHFAIALPSCTSALHLSLACLGVGSGDEVIVPDSTWIATSAPITYVGASPVFADVNTETWCIDVSAFERCITPQTKAVIVVDLYGGMPDMDQILAIAAEHGISVIEDAAEAIGSEYRGRRAGSFGALSTFSFHGSKTVTTGEGGMLVTDDRRLYERCLFLRDHGRRPGDKLFWNTEVAYKYKMSSMQAALGLAQLERIDELIERKREIFSWYQDILGQREGITLNAEGAGVRSSYWMVTIILDEVIGVTSDELLSRMAEMGIDCRPFFHPLGTLPAYAALRHTQPEHVNANAQQLARYGINLPSGFNMTRDLVQRVCNGLLAAIEHVD